MVKKQKNNHMSGAVLLSTSITLAIMTPLLLLLIPSVSSSTTTISPFSIQLANAQTANVNHVDTSPNAAVIIINRDSTTGSTIFTPTNVTVKVGEEILILNNDTAPQSFTNGNGPNDPMAGKLFDTGFIQPKQFAEYTAANVQHGTYPFFSKTNPSVKGTLTIS